MFNRRDIDQQLISKLGIPGSDTLRPHPLEHSLYFPTEDAALRAAENMPSRHYTLQIAFQPKAGLWHLRATGWMIPAVDSISGIVAGFENLAETFDGRYGGWGTPIEKS